MDEIAEEEEAAGRVPEYIKREKMEELVKELKKVKQDWDREVADLKYANHILREKNEQIVIERKSIIDKQLELEKKSWNLELQNSSLQVTVKLRG